MGYEDLDEGRKFKNYNSYKNQNIEVFRPLNVDDNESIINEFSKPHITFPLKNKTSKKNSKIKCKKDFKFSKYHKLSKNALYDYQIEEWNQGLIDDAINQMYYILNLMHKCDNKKFIKCKVEEITDFIEYHNLMDDNIQNLYKLLHDSLQVD